MNDWPDQQLLRAYAEHRSETAFGELVRRHLDAVYSAARRMTGEDQAARDTAQAVFVALAQNAAQVARHPALAGWLHTTARNLAANTVRSEIRRQQREHEAATMNQLLAGPADPAWEHLAPQLDHALGELNDADRHTLLLRYFERKSAPEIARHLGISEEAAQKRAARALDRLRDRLARRGVTVGAAGLAALLSVHAVQAAPVGLAATITAAAVLSGTTVATTTLITTKAIIMTTLQKSLLAAALAAALGTGIYQATQTARLRQQVQTLQQNQTALTSQLDQVQAERDRLASQAAQAKDAQIIAQAQLATLARQKQTPAPAAAPAAVAPAPAGNPFANMMTNLLGSGMLQAQAKKEVNSRMAHMKEMLHLSDDQTRSISDILLRQATDNSQKAMDFLSGKTTADQLAKDTASQTDPEAEIKALLTPDQLAAYPGYQQAEKTVATDNAARQEASQIAGEYDLTTDQQEQIHTALTQFALNHPPVIPNIDPANTTSTADATTAMLDQEKAQLDQKLQVLAPLLTPDQLASYREAQLNQIDMTASAIQIFLPATPAKK